MHDLVIRKGTIVDGTGRERFTGDVAIDDGVIVATGRVAERGKREIDAAGRLVTPGWVDVHTHYDGQVTWDPILAPSSWHGVTTLVMGNCGVGFAPRRPGEENFLIELMEGVEDIPGTALHEGIEWRWESFPEYLDALAAMPRVLDVAAQVPHCALRAYVLGDRAHADEIDADAIAAMARLTERGDARRCGRLHDVAHDPAPLQARPGAGHELDAGGVAGAGQRARRGRPRRVRDGCRSPGTGARSVVDDRLLPPHRPHHHVRAGADADAADGVARHAGARRPARRRRTEDRAAGADPTDRDALRPAELAAPLHLASDLRRLAGRAAARRARGAHARRRRCARASSPRSPASSIRSRGC